MALLGGYAINRVEREIKRDHFYTAKESEAFSGDFSRYATRTDMTIRINISLMKSSFFEGEIYFDQGPEIAYIKPIIWLGAGSSK